MMERDKSTKIMSWLKAAEASLRILDLRRNYYFIYMYTFERLLAGRLTALDALRLETLVLDTPHDKKSTIRRLSHAEKMRIEYLLEHDLD
jgi:hypothetical protein